MFRDFAPGPSLHLLEDPMGIYWPDWSARSMLSGDGRSRWSVNNMLGGGGAMAEQPPRRGFCLTALALLMFYFAGVGVVGAVALIVHPISLASLLGLVVQIAATALCALAGLAMWRRQARAIPLYGALCALLLAFVVARLVLTPQLAADAPAGGIIGAFTITVPLLWLYSLRTQGRLIATPHETAAQQADEADDRPRG